MTPSSPPPAQISPPPPGNKVPAPSHWNPSWYVEGSSFQRDIAFEVLTHLDLSAAHRILDLGCGDGMITRRVAILNPQAKVRGLDLSKDMVDFAKAAHRGLPNLEFIQDDIQAASWRTRFLSSAVLTVGVRRTSRKAWGSFSSRSRHPGGAGRPGLSA